MKKLGADQRLRLPLPEKLADFLDRRQVELGLESRRDVIMVLLVQAMRRETDASYSRTYRQRRKQTGTGTAESGKS